jgi:hypothetical protein
MDIIVTTPKGEIKNAAEEAKRALDGMVSHYFRKLSTYPSKLIVGDKVFYVENGFIRGFAIVEGIANSKGEACDTTKKNWSDGVYVWMRCNTWQWIDPIPMKGFQGFKYAYPRFDYKIVGDWKDPKPKVK